MLGGLATGRAGAGGKREPVRGTRPLKKPGS